MKFFAATDGAMERRRTSRAAIGRDSVTFGPPGNSFSDWCPTPHRIGNSASRDAISTGNRVHDHPPRGARLRRPDEPPKIVAVSISGASLRHWIET